MTSTGEIEQRVSDIERAESDAAGAQPSFDPLSRLEVANLEREEAIAGLYKLKEQEVKRAHDWRPIAAFLVGVFTVIWLVAAVWIVLVNQAERVSVLGWVTYERGGLPEAVQVTIIGTSAVPILALPRIILRYLFSAEPMGKMPDRGIPAMFGQASERASEIQ